MYYSFVVGLIGMVSLEFVRKVQYCFYLLICARMVSGTNTSLYGGMLMVITKEWFTVEEAAEYLCVSRRTIYKLTKEGRLPAFRIGKERHRRFRKEDIDKVPRPGEEIANVEMLLKLSAKADPVLAEVWDNEKDAAYDRV